MDAPLPVRWPGLPLHQRLGLLAGPLAAALVLAVPNALHHLGEYGSRPAAAAAVALWMAIWWFSEAVPMGLTSLLPLLLFPLLGVFEGGPAQGLAGAALPFTDAYLFLFLGGMTLGAAMEQWSLHRRVALHIMQAIGTRAPRLLLGVLVATGAVSLWISNTATAVMMVPIGMALLSELEAGRGSRLSFFGPALMLAIAYGANVGGIGTKIGTPGNSIFAGWVSANLGRDVGFLHFMAVGLPFVALFLPLVWWVLWRLGREDVLEDGRGGQVLARELAALGPLRGGERRVAVVFAAAALLWMLGDLLRPLLAPHVPTFWEGFRFTGKHYEAAVAMGAALALVASGSLTWASFRRIPWTALLLLGGSFALAAGIEGSGLSAWLIGRLEGLGHQPLWVQLAVAASATVLFSAIASNTATVNLMLNVMPRDMTVLAVTALASSCDFALPAGTPPNAIVFGSGRVRLPTMMRVGVVLDVLAILALTLYGLVWVRWVL